MGKTFGQRFGEFYKNLQRPRSLPSGIVTMNPYGDTKVLRLVNVFLEKYFSDDIQRVFILGINPGRFGGGATGINFTDAYAMEHYCGIENDFDKKRELSSTFMYELIAKMGGPAKFYSNYFLSALSPLGFTKNGKNYNYYDEKEFMDAIKPYIVRNLRKQIELGANKRVAIILGTGKNQKFFTDLNEEYKFFDRFYTLEHPRFIMQYKRKSVGNYIEKYERTLSEALRETEG